MSDFESEGWFLVSSASILFPKKDYSTMSLSTLKISRLPKIKIQEKFQILFCKILKTNATVKNYC